MLLTLSDHCLVFGLLAFDLTFRWVGLSLGHEALGFGDLVGCHFLGELFNGWPILATFPSPSGPYVASPTSFQSCHLFDL